MASEATPREGTRPAWRRVWPWVALAAAALVVRLLGLDWDQGHLFHPDERRIAEAIVGMSFHPLQLDPHFFAYGSLPLYLIRLVCSVGSSLTPWFGSWPGVVLTGRALSALWGAATVVLLASLGQRLGGRRVGLLAGGLLAMTVLHVQNSHFATVDVPLTCLVTGTLLAASWALQGGGLARPALAGLLAGLALATKVSAAVLLLPLALVPVLRFGLKERLGRTAAWLAVAGVCVIAGFAVGEPYALISPGPFLRDLAEQARMVRDARIMPYTTQYVGVTRYVYDLEQLLVWGMGPLLGLAGLLGAAAAVRRACKGAKGEWLLLSFAVPFFAVTGSFAVKFLRYLLPIYPILALWAAAWLEGWAARSRAGKIARASVVAGSALYLVAFLGIYLRPHSEVTASSWCYDHVRAGSRLLSQEWDEGFPLPLGGRGPGEYDIVSFPYYAPDSVDKVRHLARELAAADTIVLQTKRLLGAITRDPQRYPYTNNYFRELLAGDLGFEVVYEAASRPGLLGIELPDELADESFTVYDHPKVLILAKTRHLEPEALEARVRGELPSVPLTRAELLLAAPGRAPVATPPLPTVGSSWLAALRLAALLELLGLATYALLRLALPARPGLYGLAKVIGVAAPMLVAWETAALGWLPFSGATVLGTVAGVGALGAWAGWRRRELWPYGRELVLTELVAWGAFVVFLGLRAANPEVFWGEKPMDFAFLNTLYRTSSLPPPEPWFAGTSLSYTYFGHFVVAGLGKALAIAPAIMFNLGISLVACLLAAALLAAGSALTGRLAGGVATVVTGLVCGNLAGPWALATSRALNFDYFWATTRVIPDTINEFPAWSLIFADLHAHVLAMPWAVASLAVALLFVAERRVGPLAPAAGTVLWGLGAVSFAALTVTNGWGLPSWSAALAVTLAAGWWVRSHGQGFRACSRAAFLEVAVPWVTMVGAAAVLTMPFWNRYTAPQGFLGAATGIGTRPAEVAEIFGGFFVVLLPLFLGVWWRSLPAGGGHAAHWRLAAAAALSAIVCLALLDLRAAGVGHVRWAPSVAPLMGALAVLAIWVALVARGDPIAMPAALSFLAFAMVMGCDLVVVWDRMNTVFKFYLDAWLLLAVAAGPGLLALVDRGGGWNRQVWRVGVGLVGVVALFTTVSGAIGALRYRHASGPRGTLDGMAYLQSRNPREVRALAWVNEHVPGTPTELEAFGASYGPFGRVSMNTGLPAVMGWEYHVFQRGKSWDEIQAREADVASLYTSSSEATVAALLARYSVALVWVGPLERDTYGEACLTRFRQWETLLVPVFEDTGLTLFAVRDRVVGAELDAVPLPLGPPSRRTGS